MNQSLYQNRPTNTIFITYDITTSGYAKTFLHSPIGLREIVKTVPIYSVFFLQHINRKQYQS